MIVVDSNIWIDHLRLPDPRLAQLTLRRRVVIHPYTIGEIALGSFANRSVVLEQLGLLPQPPVALHEEVLNLILIEKIFGTGVGYVDCHLLASARLIDGGLVWTRDKRLRAQGERLGIAYQES